MPGQPLRVFVATGTGPAFGRLHAALAPLAADASVELFVQRGRSTPAGAALPGEDRLPREEFAARLRWADVVVAHAGAGSLHDAFLAGHTPVAVPRLLRFGEVVNDHQLELGRALAAEGKAILCEDTAELPRLVRSAPRRAAERSSAGGALVAAVREALLAPPGAPRGGGPGVVIRKLGLRAGPEAGGAPAERERPEVMQRIRQTIRGAVRRAGFDVTRLARTPGETLLGLRRLPFRTVLDVGANEGQFARRMLEVFPAAHVYSFEPVPDAFARLAAWAAPLAGRVTPLNLALGDTTGSVEMFQHTGHSPSSSLLRTTEVCETTYPFTAPQRSIRVELTTLDAALRDRVIEPDLLIKLDVQGYEDRVLRGGPETFRRAKACIVEVDLDHLYEGQPSFNDLVKSLGALGLRYAGALEQAFGEDGHVIWFDAVFRR